VAIIAGLGAIASACSTTAEKIEPTVKLEFIKPTLPASARKRCADPVEAPDRDLPEGEATDLWNIDRANLRICETRRAAAVVAVDGARP
jgi:hypothetical protein